MDCSLTNQTDKLLKKRKEAVVKVLMLDGINPGVGAELEAAGLTVEFRKGQLLEADFKPETGIVALGIRGKTKMTAETIAKFNGNLLAIGRAGSGVDNIDIKTATKNGIVVFNAPGANANAVAEAAIFHIIGLCRKARVAISGFIEKKWTKDLCQGQEVAGKILGLIGLGFVGQLVARKALGLEMKVLGYDVVAGKNLAGVEMVADLAELLKRSDIISLHLPYEGRAIIGGPELKLMKTGAHLVNCARGQLVDIEAINAALDAGQLAGYAADVFASEPPDFAQPIFDRSDTLFTPHVGASTEESEARCAQMVARQLQNFILAGTIENAVNAPRVTMEKNSGCRLTIFHGDTEGILAQVTARLFAHHCNIACMDNQRTKKGETAYTIIDTDSQINSVLDQIRQIPGVWRVRLI